MSNMLSYKGYHGKIEFDADDGILIGSVFGIRDSLNFHGCSIDEVTDSFHDCIDTYLEICKAEGIEPDKEYKGSFNIRIPQALHREAALKAELEGISLNQFIQQAIEEHVRPVKYKEIVVQFPTNSSQRTILTGANTFNKSRYRNVPSAKLS